jgi:hypothetical protein
VTIANQFSDHLLKTAKHPELKQGPMLIMLFKGHTTNHFGLYDCVENIGAVFVQHYGLRYPPRTKRAGAIMKTHILAPRA